MNQMKDEIKELKEESFAGFRFRMIIAISAFLVFGSLVLFLKLQKELSIKLFIVFLSYFLISFIFFFEYKQQKEKKILENLNFINIIADLVFLTFLIHYSGALTWVLPFAYLGTLSFGYIILSRRKALILSLLLLSIIIFLAVCSYYGLLKNYSIFGVSLYNNFNYFFTTLLVFSGLVISVSITLNFFAGNLQTQSELLEEKYKESEELKQSLEIRVEARIQELKEINEKLDEKVQKREEELKKKITELEEFGRETIKRELRIRALKKEIKELKERLNNSNELAKR